VAPYIAIRPVVLQILVDGFNILLHVRSRYVTLNQYARLWRWDEPVSNICVGYAVGKRFEGGITTIESQSNSSARYGLRTLKLAHQMERAVADINERATTIYLPLFLLEKPGIA
jgi:hypothetical protein